MTPLLSFAALLPRLLLGFLIVHTIWNAKDGKSLLIKVFLSAAVGFGVSSLLGFIWIWIGLPLSAYAWLEAIAVTLLTVWLLFKNRSQLHLPNMDIKSERLWAGGLAVGAVFYILNMALYGLQFPHGRPDAWINWNVVSRFIYLGGADWQGTFLRQFDHPDYPFFLPMTNAINWVFLGSTTRWGPFAFHLTLSLFAAGTLFALVNSFRRFKQAALAAMFFIALPFTVDQSMRQYADLLLAYLMLAGGGLTVMYLQNKDIRVVMLVGLLVGLCGWAKNEGLMAIVGFSLVWALIGFKIEDRLALKQYALGLAFPLIIIVLFKIFLAPSNDLVSGQGSLLEKVLDWERYSIILQRGITTLWRFGGTPVSFVGVLIAYAILAGRSMQRFTGMWVFGALIGFQLLVYFAVYLSTPHDLVWHLSTSLDRLYLHVLLLAFLWFFIWLKSPQELLPKES